MSVYFGSASVPRALLTGAIAWSASGVVELGSRFTQTSFGHGHCWTEWSTTAQCTSDYYAYVHSFSYIFVDLLTFVCLVEPQNLEEVDVLRHREITTKVVSAILLLTMKWFKVSRGSFHICCIALC